MSSKSNATTASPKSVEPVAKTLELPHQLPKPPELPQPPQQPIEVVDGVIPQTLSSEPKDAVIVVKETAVTSPLQQQQPPVLSPLPPSPLIPPLLPPPLLPMESLSSLVSAMEKKTVTFQETDVRHEMASVFAQRFLIMTAGFLNCFVRRMLPKLIRSRGERAESNKKRTRDGEVKIDPETNKPLDKEGEKLENEETEDEKTTHDLFFGAIELFDKVSTPTETFTPPWTTQQLLDSKDRRPWNWGYKPKLDGLVFTTFQTFMMQDEKRKALFEAAYTNETYSRFKFIVCMLQFWKQYVPSLNRLLTTLFIIVVSLLLWGAYRAIQKTKSSSSPATATLATESAGSSIFKSVFGLVKSVIKTALPK